MLVLLPPSETKAAGGDGGPLDLASLTAPELTPVRSRLVDTPLLAGLPEQARTNLAAGIPFPRRLGRPEDFAELALAIIGHGYLNGEVIRMDAALRMAPR